MPDWLPSADWKDFCQMRGAKFTARAKQLIIGKLEKLRQEGHDPAAVLQQSLERGWSGVFEIKGDYHGTRQINHQQASGRHGGLTGAETGNGFGGRKSQTQLYADATERIIAERRRKATESPDKAMLGQPRPAHPLIAADLRDVEEVR
jgi:hypothetical protein